MTLSAQYTYADRTSGSLTKVLIELLDVAAAVTLTTKNKFGSFGGVQMK